MARFTQNQLITAGFVAVILFVIFVLPSLMLLWELNNYGTYPWWRTTKP